MILLFSHQLTESQITDAKNNWEVEDFISLPEELQGIWSNIDPDAKSIVSLLAPIYTFVEKYAEQKDLILIQGDFGASCLLKDYALKKGFVPVYATTKRMVKEYAVDGKNIKKSIFEHRRFREYE